MHFDWREFFETIRNEVKDMQELDPTGAPTPLRLNGQEYKAFPFRDIDHEEFNKWCGREYLDRVKQTTDDPEIISVAINNTIGMSWMGTGRAVAMTARGVHKMACLLCRDGKAPPYEAVATSEGIKEVTDVFVSLHSFESSGSSGSSEGN